MSGLESWIHVFENGADSGPVVVALHGTGGDERDLLPLARVLFPEAPILSPRGKVSEAGMNRWFARMAEGVFDVDDVIARAGELAAFITDALEHYGLGGRDVFAVGFSNGANIATATALLHPDTLSTAVAFSGMYPFAERDPIGDAQGVRLFLANGESDPMAPRPSGDRLEQLASQHGASVTRFLRPGGHGITPEELAAAKDWLAALQD